MIYIYLNKEDKCIISEKKIENKYKLIKLFHWEFDTLPISNIRPWKILGTSDSLYNSSVLDYLNTLEEPPKEKHLNYVYKKDVDKIFDEYSNILDTFINLNLIPNNKWDLKFKKYIVYDCDVENYLTTILNKDILSLCNTFIDLDRRKKDIILKLSTLRTRENQLNFINTIDIDLDIFQFLPPWFKINSQVFLERERTIKNVDVLVPEFKEFTDIDSYTGESLIRDHIYEIIKPGDVLSSHEIKEKLNELYRSLGIQRLPKVNDLDDYFELSRTYSRHYRILKIKN